jgi:hypothetical protein
MTKEALMSIPPTHRRIETVQPGLLFADTRELTWTDDSWGDDNEIANKILSNGGYAVGFKRFVYDPEQGKKYLDDGWVFFKGTVISKDSILDGSAERVHSGFVINDTLRSNVRINEINVIWFRDYGKVWQFYSEDRRI